MADVFISYAREDRERVALLAHAIEQRGWSVWWDSRLQFGQSFSRIIEKELDESQCVVVVWTKSSVESDWVRNEADEGRKRQVLVPILLDRDIRIPLAFRQLHMADLTSWPAKRGDFDQCIATIQSFVGPPRTAPVAPPKPKPVQTQTVQKPAPPPPRPQPAKPLRVWRRQAVTTAIARRPREERARAMFMARARQQIPQPWLFGKAPASIAFRPLPVAFSVVVMLWVCISIVLIFS